MKLTEEQQDIIASEGNIKINAVAGSGKTTTMIEYAKSRPSGSRILYLAFNKTVRQEAARKFARLGLTQVSVETAHSLAYKYVVYKNGYQVQANGYKIHELVELLRLQGNGERHTEYVVANHVSRLVTYFCNSRPSKIRALNYLDIVSDDKARTFVTFFYDYIVQQARIFLSKMNRGEIAVTHDFYLKKFQLQNVRLPYDYILFDEGQDASPAMLDVFLRQPAIKVIVGDTHQQIYGWRFAVNSLDKVDFPTYRLSTSFRFNQPLAELARQVLQWKNYLSDTPPVPIIGSGEPTDRVSQATIARTNLGLLLKAIEWITEHGRSTRIYFEGNIHSYTYADEGASLYDVLHLYNGRRAAIRDPLIRSMKDLEDLADYIDLTEDVQLKMMVQVVKEYGNDIPRILQSLKDQHVGSNQKDKADMIFSTVHRSKGMEYATVHLANDFIREGTLEILNKEEVEADKVNEEINLLYVAITRTQTAIHLPETLRPKDFADSPDIYWVKVTEEESEEENREVPKERAVNKKLQTETSTKEKAYCVAEVRQTHRDAYRPWTPALDGELRHMHRQGTSVRAMAQHFGRTRGAIYSRIKKLKN